MSRGSGLYEVVTTAGVPVRLHDMRPPNGWRHGSAQQANVGPLARLREGLVKVRRTLHVPSGFRRREGAGQSGGRGIRTLEELAPLAVFKTAAIGH